MKERKEAAAKGKNERDLNTDSHLRLLYMQPLQHLTLPTMHFLFVTILTSLSLLEMTCQDPSPFVKSQSPEILFHTTLLLFPQGKVSCSYSQGTASQVLISRATTSFFFSEKQTRTLSKVGLGIQVFKQISKRSPILGHTTHPKCSSECQRVLCTKSIKKVRGFPLKHQFRTIIFPLLPTT